MKRNYRIALVLPNNIAYSGTFLESHINHLATISTFSSEYPLYGVSNPLKKGYRYFKEKLMLYKLRRNRIDILLAEFGTIGAEILPFAKKYGIPLAVEFRGFDLSIDRYVSLYLKRYIELSKYAKLIVVKSNSMLAKLEKIGCHLDNVVIIPSGYDVNIFNDNVFSVKSNAVLFVGRFVEKKGPTLVIRAFNESLKNSSNIKLLMVGDGVMLQECKELVFNLGIESCVNFYGVATPTEVRALMQESFCLINHSVTASNGDQEGLPNVILEAMGSGLPVIATRHGGNSDIIVHGENGFLVDEHDTQKAGRYLNNLFENKTKARLMGKNGYKLVKDKYTKYSCIDSLKRELDKRMKS
ncbi:glycosyltransferase family 4 protein [Marinoscillum furvescens]|uniref:Glycosyltransferase involved in cell wall biosynthesis n=1 Tax=Marinoscillum furvescens DSM 4134 TaxID=1122208 RepID=A0A3D9L330_MARFU|nr:glycosyltransferase family 4 protein [Marinoscillum furvescens]RED99549.1 glycosyltransferase involved in cell wall biosynthesis [Marinoscillum furvescens DSM 4134]